MERASFLLKILKGKREEALTKLEILLPEATAQFKNLGADNFSVWQAEDLIFGYYEAENIDILRKVGSAVRAWSEQLEESTMLISSPGNMRRMYTALGLPRVEKKNLGHRVFMTRLKPGMAEEYRARHAAIETDSAPKGPINNFTIWNGGDYICGYAELDEGFIIDRSAEGMEKDRAWESAMLEVMEWLTDDVNALFGFEKKPVRCLVK